MTSRRIQLLVAVLAVGCLAPATPAITQAGLDAASLRFEQHEITLAGERRQTVLTGALLRSSDSEAANLAALHIDETGTRRLLIYALEDDAWNLKLDEALRRGVSLVDIANIAGRDRLISYENGRLSWFDPDSATEREFARVAVEIHPSDRSQIHHVDISRDLNDDGLDDLVVPAVDGFWVLTQSGDGSFAEAVKLGPPEPFRNERAFDDERPYGETGIVPVTIPWYLSRVHQFDYNRDGRSDLVFWNEDHFDVYLQNSRGHFDSVAETFTVDAPFDSDGTYSLIFGFSGESKFKLLFGFRKKQKRTVLRGFRDLNGDQVADLITHSLEGRSMVRQRSRYEVYLGSATEDGVVFAAKPSTSIQPQGRPGEPAGYAVQWLQDLDDDGKVDATLQVVKTGLGGMLRVLGANSIAVNLEFYRMEGDTYPDEPTARRKVRPDSHPFKRSRGPFFPTVLLGDVSGDGRADLLVGKDWEELHVFRGVPGPDLFTRQPQKVAVALTANEADARLVDLDRDGRQDLLVYHPPRKRATSGPHRVTMLIAR